LLDDELVESNASLPWITTFMADAGERMRALTTALDSHTTHSDVSHASEFPEDEDQRPLPMPMWNDNDCVDVMPVHAPSSPADVGMPSAPITMSAFTHTPTLFCADPVDSAEHVSAPNEPSRLSNADATARALEALAWRIRNGDLVILGFSADRGDAAALATALAALLGAGS